MNASSPLLSTIAETPRVERKWTLRNDEWVNVMFAIHQGPGGRYDRPAELPTYKETRK